MCPPKRALVLEVHRGDTFHSRSCNSATSFGGPSQFLHGMRQLSSHQTLTLRNEFQQFTMTGAGGLQLSSRGTCALTLFILAARAARPYNCHCPHQRVGMVPTKITPPSHPDVFLFRKMQGPLET